MRAVDTNVLVRLIVGDDAKQSSAAETFVERGAWVSHLVLVEATWVMASVYDRAPSEIATAVEMLLHHEHLTVEKSDVVSGALQSFRRHPALGFSDCLVLEVAKSAGHVPLGTFDRPLARLEGTQRL